MSTDCVPAARSTNRSTEIGESSKSKSINITGQQQREPPVGIEPTTCSLRETRAAAPDALAAPIARPNAQNAHDAPSTRPARSTTRYTAYPADRPPQVRLGSRSTGTGRWCASPGKEQSLAAMRARPRDRSQQPRSDAVARKVPACLARPNIDSAQFFSHTFDYDHDA